MLHLGFAVLVAFLGEIDFAALDEVGKHMFQLPFRFGGQNFHDISKEAPFCFLGNIAAHAHLVKEKLEKFDASLMEKLEQTLALSEDNERPNWIGGIVDALDDAKNTLDVIDSSGALPSSWEECLGFHYFHRGQTTTGRLSSKRTLKKEL